MSSRHRDQCRNLRPDARPPASRVEADDCPAQQAAGAQHLQVHSRMQQAVVLGRSIETAQVERVRAGQVDDSSEQRRVEHRRRVAAQQREQRPAGTSRQRAKREGHRSGQRKQRWSKHAEQQVLTHVHREHLVMRTDRRQHRDGDADPCQQQATVAPHWPAVTALAKPVSAGAVAANQAGDQQQRDQLEHARYSARPVPKMPEVATPAGPRVSQPPARIRTSAMTFQLRS
jgi:hypothetical protein